MANADHRRLDTCPISLVNRIHKVSIMKDKLVYVGGQVSLTGVMFLFSLIAAKLLGPEQMGAWQTIFLISTYGMFISAGIINGMGRDVPYYRGKGDERKTKRNNRHDAHLLGDRDYHQSDGCRGGISCIFR